MSAAPKSADRFDSHSAINRFQTSVVLQLMLLATLSLAATSASSTVLQVIMLWSFGDRRVELDSGVSLPPSPSLLSSLTSTTPEVPTPGGVDVSPPAAPVPPLDSQESEAIFLETVKRRMSIKTPLDTSFYRPFARAKSDAKRTWAANATSLVFVAGAEGTGHHFITALMMRLSELMPMTLTQEQMFQALWWKPDENDPAVFWGAMESFMEWVQTARSMGKHPAFCARTCLRGTGMKHCSWISGLQQQNAGLMLAGKGHNGTFQPIGQMFSYPFSRSWNETEDGTHFPKIADLQYLCDLAGLRLKVIVLYRDPVDAIMSMNNRGLPKIWRRAGRTFKLHKQVGLFRSPLTALLSPHLTALLSPHLSSFLSSLLSSLLSATLISALSPPPLRPLLAAGRPLPLATTRRWCDPSSSQWCPPPTPPPRRSTSSSRSSTRCTSRLHPAPPFQVVMPLHAGAYTPSRLPTGTSSSSCSARRTTSSSTTPTCCCARRTTRRRSPASSSCRVRDSASPPHARQVV